MLCVVVSYCGFGYLILFYLMRIIAVTRRDLGKKLDSLADCWVLIYPGQYLWFLEALNIIASRILAINCHTARCNRFGHHFML